MPRSSSAKARSSHRRRIGCGKTTLVSGCMWAFTSLRSIVPPATCASEARASVEDEPRQKSQAHPGAQNRHDSQGASFLNPTRKIKDLAAEHDLEPRGPARKRRSSTASARALRQIGLHATQVLGSYPVRAFPPASAARRHRHLHVAQSESGGGDEPTSPSKSPPRVGHSAASSTLMDRGIVSSMLLSPTSCRSAPGFEQHRRHVRRRIRSRWARPSTIITIRGSPIREPHESMLSAEPGQRGRKPVAIEGCPAQPWPAHFFGCRFAERCPSVGPS